MYHVCRFSDTGSDVTGEPAKRAMSCSPRRKPCGSDRIGDSPAPEGRHHRRFQAKTFRESYAIPCFFKKTITSS